jgi:fluoroquinolone transport system permease protein
MQTDVTVQIRNNLYTIGPIVAVLVAFLLSRVVSADTLGETIPVTMLMVIGGSTLLYVAGLILFEKDEGTLHALIVSPLRTREYLLSKVTTLTVLATFESVILVGALLLLVGVDALTAFSVPLLLLGIVLLSVVYTLIGIVLIVRYESITDFLVPVLVIALVMQLPAVQFSGLIEGYALYVIPSTAQTLIMAGAWHSLEAWQWLYALGYSAVTIGLLTVWAFRAFKTHIVMRVG